MSEISKEAKILSVGISFGIFVTFDLDAEDTVSKTFKSLGFEAGRHFAPVGIDAAGKRDIEGLLPDSVRKAVYSANDDVVQIAVSGTNSERMPSGSSSGCS